MLLMVVQMILCTIIVVEVVQSLHGEDHIQMDSPEPALRVAMVVAEAE